MAKRGRTKQNFDFNYFSNIEFIGRKRISSNIVLITLKGGPAWGGKGKVFLFIMTVNGFGGGGVKGTHLLAL